MIRKPQADWSREDHTVEVARKVGSVASTAVTAGLSGANRAIALVRAVRAGIPALCCGMAALAAGVVGLNLPMFLLAGSFSVFLGWIAVRNLGVAFGSGERRPAGPSPAWDMAAGPGDRQNPWGDAGPVRGAEGSAAGHEVVICYSRKRLLVNAAKVVVVICLLVVAVLASNAYRNPLIALGLPVAVVMILWYLTWLLHRALDKDLTAVAWDGHQLRLRPLGSNRRMPWAAVEQVTVERRVTRLYGVIPISTTYALKFRLCPGRWRKTVRIPASLLAVPVEALGELAGALARGRTGPAFGAAQELNPFDTGGASLNPPRAFGRKGY